MTIHTKPDCKHCGSAEVLAEVCTLLGEVARFLIGFEDCDDNGGLALDLLQRIKVARGLVEATAAPAGGA